jgi:hypothetical protein
MLVFLCFKFLCCRSVPITTNIDILAQAAQFVGASRSINTSHTLFLSCVQCGARLQLSRDALCMHSIVHVFSSGGGAQELRELHIAGLQPDLLMCTRMHMNRFSHRTLSRRFFKCHIPLLSWKHALVSSKWFLKQAYCPTAIDPSCAHIYAHARVNKFDPGERTKFNLLHPQENAPKACAQSSDAGPSEPPPQPGTAGPYGLHRRFHALHVHALQVVQLLVELRDEQGQGAFALLKLCHLQQRASEVRAAPCRALSASPLAACRAQPQLTTSAC